ncbi:hypothetical protein [Thiocapsa bogorovii]|uniref:hypothetical protein n=1 Tax=Thiocapsa bogorovii TaxID=521689 RepID=UPI001E3B954A|nr:hypothetical protein [Thiocapsa bogorovii]UHD19037.1 hypothetical protein LT988_23230 [Thiocapsa bogorovii]
MLNCNASTRQPSFNTKNSRSAHPTRLRQLGRQLGDARKPRLQIAHPVEDNGRKVRASCFDGLPVMPVWREVLALAKLGFFQVVGQRVGKMHLQLP